LPCLLLSCAEKIPAAFPVANAGAVLYGAGREAAEGELELAEVKTWDYVFEQPLPAGSFSLGIDYAFSAPPGETLKNLYDLVLRINSGEAWALPWDASFLFPGEGEEAPVYAVPLSGPALGGFSLSLVPRDGRSKGRIFPRTAEAPRLIIKSLGFEKTWFGFIRETGGRLRATPFVYGRDDGGFSIAAPARWQTPGQMELRVIRQAAGPGTLVVETGRPDQAADQAGRRRFEISPGLERFRIPAAVLAGGSGSPGGSTEGLTLWGEGIAACYLAAGETPLFPRPISADPEIILAYPPEAWRNPRFEVFRWEQFPAVLIIDTADYAVQDRLFKRLCFFVEKKGFRGRVASDREIEKLHGWNAHDYRAEDLARFFQAAADFPLSPEERELEQLLFDEGIIRREGNSIRGGEGAVLSVSRESAAYLRSLFMAHEGFHGLFFIDRDFRDFSRRRWDGLSRRTRSFILSYFDYQSYDTADSGLMVNELMAHCLQQPAIQAPRYFGETLAARIDASPWRREVLPEKDETAGNWPELGRAFRVEAEAFSEYVNRRWGLSAGRAGYVQIRE
jgi:hypothetical protein